MLGDDFWGNWTKRKELPGLHALELGVFVGGTNQHSSQARQKNKKMGGAEKKKLPKEGKPGKRRVDCSETVIILFLGH